MYMQLLTDAFVSGDQEEFTYYSRFYIQHLYWNMVRQPNKAGSAIFEQKDIDARVQSTDFYVETDDNKLAFKAFLEFVAKESKFKGIFKYIHNTEQEEQEEL